MTAALSGCMSADGSSGNVTLKLIAADYDVNGGHSSRDYWANVVGEFEAAHPGIKVDVTIETWTDIDRKVAEMVEAGKAPDIAQTGGYAAYAAEEKLYSADQMLSIPVQSNFLAPLISAGEQQRTQYGLPFVASTRLLFYNKKLFAEAGIEKAPKTWDQLRDAAEKLKDSTDVTYPFALPLGPEEAQIETMMWLLSNDSNGYVDPGGSYAIDSKENTDAITWVKSNLVERGLTGPTAPGKLDRKQAFVAFTEGKVGMLNGHPSLMKEAEAAGVEVGKVPMPGRLGTPKTSVGVADWIMGFKQNGHRTEIGKFFNFLFADKHVLAFASQNNMLPPTVTASEAMEADARHKSLKGFLEALPSAQLPPVNKNSWSAVSSEIKLKIGSAVAPGNSPGKVLEGIAKKATEAETTEEE
ncbi:extracellular solute-binding protein [Streptomyces sp. CAU 1734]|uniref:extracellular solute-binding protein n=1 Tax=Streptomyces sp. CAU 1734 TaxID=3140360 RepID=UPI0032606C58